VTAYTVSPPNPTDKLRELVRSAIDFERQLIELDNLCTPRDQTTLAAALDSLTTDLEQLPYLSSRQLSRRIQVHKLRIDLTIPLASLEPTT